MRLNRKDWLLTSTSYIALMTAYHFSTRIISQTGVNMLLHDHPAP